MNFQFLSEMLNVSNNNDVVLVEINSAQGILLMYGVKAYNGNNE